MTRESGELPQDLVHGLLRLCEGDLSFRLPRSRTRDSADTAAFFVNSIAEELERILRTSREQETRLSAFLERMSQTLVQVASGDLSAQMDRDYAGDSVDVLAYLLNNTITELASFVDAAQHKAEEDRLRLEALVAERTRELDRLATTDVLTETYNRRRLEELGQQEIGRATRYRYSLCVAMLDLDHFKDVNDVFGHAVGDVALRRAADAIRSRVRAHDHVGRYGGEEFVIIAPSTTMDGARHLAGAVRDAVSNATFEVTGKPVTLTISVGLAQWVRGESLDAVLSRADGAMYLAKNAGRNTVREPESPDSTPAS